MTQEALVAEIRGLRERVPGITDAAVAAVDGLLVAADTAAEIDPESLAALAAAGLGLARRTAAVSRRGPLRRTVTHCGGGYAVIYGVGDTALLAVLGDEGLDLVRLQRETGALIERLDDLLCGRTR
ncbi:roadblock/LC7 domain-containing protein [Streptacidiphilus neutrinimicus]|uniref:roadblock/LC7 domain-containing protein n=1 Tax=Streptacidiphilus neutrinimicus TaxID=105420 RepID=UPI0007C8268D|nr:roadblock/LC7 domain-containing protein [Streptacidiphilus neutrinimicus]